MKKIALICIIVTTLICCKKDNVISFGEIKLGMKIQNFEKKFPSKNRDIAFDEYVSKRIDTLKILRNITLTNVNADFTNGKLILVNCDYNKDLFDFLKNNYGIVRSGSKRESKYKFTTFKSNSDNVECVFESFNGKGIIGMSNINEIRKRNRKK